MSEKYNQSQDILFFLRDNHSGAENVVPSAVIERTFNIKGAALRQIINNLRCESQPVCSNVNGYYYAKNKNEINDTIQQLIGRTKKINDAVQGLALFRNGTEAAYDD